MNLTHGNAFNTKCRIANSIILWKYATQISIKFHLVSTVRSPQTELKYMTLIGHNTHRFYRNRVVLIVTCEVHDAIKVWVSTHFQNVFNISSSSEQAYTTRTQSSSCPGLRSVQLTKHCRATVTYPVLSSKLLVSRCQPVIAYHNLYHSWFSLL